MFHIANLIDIWPILVVGGLLTLLFALLPKARQTIVFGGAALGVLLTFAGLMQTADQNRELARHERLKVAFDYSQRLNQPEISKRFERAKDALDKVSGKQPAEIDMLFKQEEISEPLKWVFNTFEEMGQAVRLGYADEKALCVVWRDIALKYFSALKPWLDHHRAQLQNYTLYEPYEWLANRWQKDCSAVT